jgi:hypothetical protein
MYIPAGILAYKLFKGLVIYETSLMLIKLTKIIIGSIKNARLASGVFSVIMATVFVG